ncbi:MAG: Holliday junction resolvase RuvX [Pseudomonadota bacterium]|nr:MAG: Holliday junction resolvase RuvX [Pseudomonadota bacterium]
MRPRTALAFDYGARRIGIASGDTLTASVAPRATVRVLESGPDWAAIAREIRELRPDVLVVGAPYNADGSPSALTAAARAFAAELERRFGLPVHQVDERWSSLEASARLKERRASGARRRRVSREDIDSAAAAVILERWLAGEGSDGGAGGSERT